jgi:hypothetical protein
VDDGGRLGGRSERIATVLALALLLVSLFSALSGPGPLHAPIASAQYQYDEYGQYGGKVTICHKGVTITVSKHAVPAHVRLHGDTIGPCRPGSRPGKKT